MKLFDAILLSLSAGFFIIGVHQVMTLGITYAYWILMLSMLLLFWYRVRKKKEQRNEPSGKAYFKKKKYSK